MISMIQPLFAGNALQLFLKPPVGFTRWKILRNGSGVFSGPNDASSVVAYDGDATVVIDSAGSLTNDVRWFYGPFYTADNGVTWTAGPVNSGTPSAIYVDNSTDVLSLMRERLEAGLLVECQRGNFQTELGYIQVYTAPPQMEQGLRFPLVTLHLDGEDPSGRALGELISSNNFNSIGFDGYESEGWIADVRLQIVGWSLNSDERIELRKAIRRLVAANLPIFDSYGWLEIGLSQQDIDAVNGEYPAQMYQVSNTFTCMAPVSVSGRSTLVVRDISLRSING